MFSARRKPKRIARDDPQDDSKDNEEGMSTQTTLLASDLTPPPSRLKADGKSEDQNTGPVVRRPNLAPKTKSKLRTSFAPDEAEDSSDAPIVVKPKPRLGQTNSSQHLPRFNVESRAQDDTSTSSRPSYSKSALEELRNSTPSTPKDLSIHDPSSDAEDGIRTLDLSSKFGTAPASQSNNPIPTASEIAEKKARRARLAKESTAAEDFIPLDDNELYDSDGEFKPRRLQVGSYLRPADAAEKEDTRLVRDDEDVLEGFEEYTEDAESKRLTMGRKQLLAAQRRDRDAMREMIDHAEGSSTSDSDSEVERNHAYEFAQTAYGMDGLKAVKAAQRRAGRDRPRQPREVTPVPKLAVALGKLKERIAKVELERVRVERRREEIKKERADVLASQEHIQRSLTEAGEELEKIRLRQAEEQEGKVVNGGGTAGRGLDSMGLTPEPT